MLPSVSRVTPEPTPSASLVVTLMETTDGRAFAATALASVVESSDGLMVMDWLEPPPLVVMVVLLPMTPAKCRAATSAPAPTTPPRRPSRAALTAGCLRLGLSSSGAPAPGPGTPGAWGGTGGTWA